MSTIQCSVVVFGSSVKFFVRLHLLFALLSLTYDQKGFTTYLEYTYRETDQQKFQSSKKTWLRFHSLLFKFEYTFLFLSKELYITDRIYFHPESGQKQIEPWFTFILSTLVRFRASVFFSSQNFYLHRRIKRKRTKSKRTYTTKNGLAHTHTRKSTASTL